MEQIQTRAQHLRPSMTANTPVDFPAVAVLSNSLSQRRPVERAAEVEA
jgi:hypothetical protein